MPKRPKNEHELWHVSPGLDILERWMKHDEKSFPQAADATKQIKYCAAKGRSGGATINSNKDARGPLKVFTTKRRVLRLKAQECRAARWRRHRAQSSGSGFGLWHSVVAVPVYAIPVVEVEL
jgi:hypothetical protein